ncbi:MAG: hypothetical protein AMQ74_01628 [Candidatus Methanofastidiosum methylothiophilum]|uniref:Uncharacterized protein n=1 Tax=Candidatus Methanofastidiosum methylothiophilum TaxID=1705564 RepID=A0A150ITE3_9EURY|nr:MAG: hypothetical protein AMQ74_01628 [Candidatus Methanofastidiosum methylthiophilus]
MSRGEASILSYKVIDESLVGSNLGSNTVKTLSTSENLFNNFSASFVSLIPLYFKSLTISAFAQISHIGSEWYV